MELYIKSIIMFIKSDMEYKLSFILTLIGSALATFFSVLGIAFLLNKFGKVGIWSIDEIMLTTGIAVFGHSFTEIFLQGLNHFHMRVKTGMLDQMMTRPRSLLFQVVCSDFQANKIGRLLEAISLIIYGLINVDISWSPFKIFVFLLILLGTNIIFASLLVLKGAFCFWTIDGMELMNILQEGGRDLSSYPISIYKKWFADFFTYIVPFGMCNYFPIMYLLRKRKCTYMVCFCSIAYNSIFVFHVDFVENRDF